jgi:hypothetical protein
MFATYPSYATLKKTYAKYDPLRFVSLSESILDSIPTFLTRAELELYM